MGMIENTKTDLSHQPLLESVRERSKMHKKREGEGNRRREINRA